MHRVSAWWLPIVLGSALAAQAQQKNAAPPALATADVNKALAQAREDYLADGKGTKSNPRTLMYIHQRERISHTPLLQIALAQTVQKDPEATKTIEAIDDAPVRAYAYIRVAKMQLNQDQKDLAQKSLDRAVALLQGDAKEAAPQLWAHVLSALVWMHGDIETAKAAAEKAGCPWDSLDQEDRQYMLAQYHLSKKDVAAARQALNVLPAKTFAQRKGQQSLRNDDGAGFYDWIARSVAEPDAYTADHVLLEWLQGDDQPELLEDVLANIKDPLGKIMGYSSAVQQYQKQDKADKAKAAFARAETAVKEVKDEELKKRLDVALVMTQLEMDGHSAADAIRKSKLIEKYTGEPWLLLLIPPLLECNELELAEEIAAQGKLDDRLHGYFVVAFTKANRDKEAAAHLEQVKHFMALPRTLMGLALQQHENGDEQAARATILKAIARGEEVRSTNKWVPDEGEVRLQEKWDLMSEIYSAAVQMGFADIVLEKSPTSSSVRTVAQALGRRHDLATLQKWVEKFKEQDRAQGDRCFAWLGFAEGLALSLAKE